MFVLITSFFCYVLNNYMVKFKKRARCKPFLWLNSELLSELRRLEKLIAKRSRNTVDEKNFRICKNSVTHAIPNAKKKITTNAVFQNPDTRSVWKVCDAILGNKNQSHQPIASLLVNGEVSNNLTAIAGEFAKVFELPAMENETQFLKFCCG